MPTGDNVLIAQAVTHAKLAAEMANRAEALFENGKEPTDVRNAALIAQAHAEAAQALVACISLSSQIE